MATATTSTSSPAAKASARSGLVPRPPASRAGRAEAHRVDHAERDDRDQHEGVGQPLQLRVRCLPRGHDCRNRVLSRNIGPRRRSRACPLSILAPSLCWSCGAAAAGHACAGHAGAGCAGSTRVASRSTVCRPGRRWPTRPGPGARARAEVPRRPRAGRRDGGGDRGRGARRGCWTARWCRCRSRARGCASAATTRRRRWPAALAARTGLPVLDVARAQRRPGPPDGPRAAARGWPGHPRFRARRLGPPRAVLVDDVITTGATLAACARHFAQPARAKSWQFPTRAPQEGDEGVPSPDSTQLTGGAACASR